MPQSRHSCIISAKIAIFAQKQMLCRLAALWHGTQILY
jgi:hypothetical protein